MSHLASAAILDVDGTLLPGSVGVDLLRSLMAAGVCDPRAGHQVFHVLEDHRAGVIDFRTMATRAYGAYAAALAGVEVERVAEISRRAWASGRARLFGFVPELLACLRTHGFEPMLISGSPIEMVALVADTLGITHAHGAAFARADGRYTGVLERGSGMPGEKLRIFEQHGRVFALERSFALGDSLTDASLFERVGVPLAFEPDADLAELAAARGWTVATRDDVVERARALLGVGRVGVVSAPARAGGWAC